MDNQKEIGKVFLTYLLRAPMTWVVIFISLFPYALIEIAGINAVSSLFMPRNFTEILNGTNVIRLITPVFVHYSIFHLLGNLYLWWLFGDSIERLSKNLFIYIFFGAAITGNAFQYILAGPNFGGLSGIIYAQFGFMWLNSKLTDNKECYFDDRLAILLFILLFVAATGIFGKFADGAHFAGLAFGLSVAWFRGNKAVR